MINHEQQQASNHESSLSLALFFFFFPFLSSFGGSSLSISVLQLAPLTLSLIFDRRRGSLDGCDERLRPLRTALRGGLRLLCTHVRTTITA